MNKDESEDVVFTLDVKRDVKGTQNFDIEVLSGNEVVMTQPFSVSIQERTGFFSGLTGAVTGVGDNWYLWVIGLVNLALVVGIVVVVIRILRRP